MYLDIVILSGIGVIGLMVAFFGGVYYFLRKDAKKNTSQN